MNRLHTACKRGALEGLWVGLQSLGGVGGVGFGGGSQKLSLRGAASMAGSLERE